MSHHVTDANINGNLIPAYFEEEGFAFLYLPPLEKKKYKLQYRTGTTLMPLHVYNDGTYNVYGLSKTESQITITLKMYGRQTVKIRCSKPEKVISAKDGLVLESYTFFPDEGMLHITINATNMQGTGGEIKLMY
jgi:hypothetical protein